MKYSGDSFIISQSDTDNISQSGHATIATRMSTLSGFDVVDKSVAPDGDLAHRPREWLKRQKNAARIADMVRQKNNPAYTVPHTFISHGNVRDEFVTGVAVDDLPSTYTMDHKSELITSIGQFVNDMSELERTKKYKPKTFADLRVKSVDELNEMMRLCSVSDKHQAKIRDIFEYLRDLPENSELVFAHNDLSVANVLIEPDTGRVGIIDFEYAGFESKTDIMYGQLPYPQLWEYVNKLPRTKNSDLYWNYDPDIYALFRFMRYVVAEMQHIGATRYAVDEIQGIVNRTDFTEVMKLNAIIGAMIMNANIKFMHAKRFHKLNTRKTSAPIVPIAHYNKGMDL